MHHVAGFKFPAQLAVRRADCIDIPVAASEIDRALRHHRTRQKYVEWISNCLILRLHAMEPFRLEAPLSPGGELPLHRSGFGVQRIYPSVVACDINDSGRHRRARRYWTARYVLPNLPTGFRVNRVPFPSSPPK